MTARRHFLIPWSERTHRMESGQSVFSLALLLHALSIFFTDFEKKTDCFAVLLELGEIIATKQKQQEDNSEDDICYLENICGAGKT